MYSEKYQIKLFAAICLSVATLVLTACSPIVGADRDEFGCLGSAGYLWCPRTQQCERPWELLKEKDLEDTQQAFRNYCAANDS